MVLPRAVVVLCTADIQDGGREHGHVGGAVRNQQHRALRAQLALLPGRVHGGLPDSALSVTAADAVHVGQVAEGRLQVLRMRETRWHEMM